MTLHNEDFIHFDICIDRLNSAWRTLTMIKEHSGHPLVGPAFRFALVEYATPYNRSDGVNKKRYYLDESYVPAEFLELHERLLASRDQIHAHADLTILEAKLSYTDLQGQRLVSTVRNNIHGLEELDNIDATIHLIEGTLRNMYADREIRKLALKS